MGLDDKTVHFDNSDERIVHIHRVNIVANIKGEWTRPTILVAAKGQTPVFCHEVLVKGPSRIVERPPGVHIVLEESTEVVPLDAEGKKIDLPPWAKPTENSISDHLKEAIDDHRRIGTIIDQAIEALSYAGMDADASALRGAARALVRVRRGLAHEADRFLAETQPIEADFKRDDRS